MANENFGLGFTVEPLALWSEGEGYTGPATSVLYFPLAEDTVGPAITISADLVSLDTTGPATSVLLDLVALDTTGPATSINASGLCAAQSVLSGPGQSILDGTGGFGTNILSCP